MYDYSSEDDPYYHEIIIENPDGSTEVLLPPVVSDYFYYGEKIRTEKDIEKKLLYCYKQLETLKFQMDFELDNPKGLGYAFPCIACRDTAPRLYMRLGEWDKAKEFIEKCASLRAYYPEDGSKELKHLELYRNVALKIIEFVSSNPGCLQRNICKTLGFVGDEAKICKDFLRWTFLLRKEAFRNTNKLFIITKEL